MYLIIRIILFIYSMAAFNYGTTFEERAAEVINFFANTPYPSTGTPKYTFFYAEAKFYDYEKNNNTNKLSEALALVNGGLENLNDKDPPFQLWRAMDCYLRYKHLFSTDLKIKMKDKITGSPYFNYHNTQNKIWMAATARYLAQESWPAQSFRSDYDSIDPTGRETLLNKMEKFVHVGETEHNSPTYFAMHYGPLRSLADYAQDSEIKNKAALTAEWLLASAAGEWLEGLWSAASERMYMENAFGNQTVYGAGSSTLRLYFDGPTPTNWNDELVDAVQAVISTYRVPIQLESIAKDRNTSFTHRESHFSVDTYFFCTTFLNQEYALYSQHENFINWGSAGGMDQVQRWSVSFKRGNGKSHFFIQHPNGTKVSNFGATEYEQVLQSKNALVGVWNIPSTNVVGHKGQNSSNPIRGWIPENPLEKFNESSTSGRVYLHYGNVMIAFFLSEPFSWNGSSNSFSITSKKLALILELSDPKKYSGTTAIEQLSNFKLAFENNWISRVDLSKVTNTDPGITYQSLEGTIMETVFRKSDHINGQLVVYDRSSWPLLDNPWIKQNFLSDTMTISYGDSIRQYDFRNWEITNVYRNTSIDLFNPVPLNSFESDFYHHYNLLGKRIPKDQKNKNLLKIYFLVPKLAHPSNNP